MLFKMNFNMAFVPFCRRWGSSNFAILVLILCFALRPIPGPGLVCAAASSPVEESFRPESSCDSPSCSAREECAAAAASDTISGLQITVKASNFRHAPSSIQSYGSISLVNTHPSHSVTIRSIEIHPVRILSVQDLLKNGITCTYTCSHNEPAEAQITIGDFNNKNLSIGPGEMRSMPITFFPSVPSNLVEMYRLQEAYEQLHYYDYRSRMGKNRVFARELSHLAEEHRRFRERDMSSPPNGLGADTDALAATQAKVTITGTNTGGIRSDGEDQQFHTAGGTDETCACKHGRIDLDPGLEQSLRSNPRLHVSVANLQIEIDDSSEVGGPKNYVAPIVATSLRTNKYSLPSTLTFHPSPASGGGKNEYDLYIVNPYRDRHIHVNEVFTDALPSALKIERKHISQQDDEASFGSATERFTNLQSAERLISDLGMECAGSNITADAILVDREDPLDGPLVVGPGNCFPHYVGTVRLLDAFIENDVFIASFLGFIYIRTSADNLAIAVEVASRETSKNDGSVDCSGCLVSEEGRADDFSELDAENLKSTETAKIEELGTEGVGGRNPYNMMSASPPFVHFGLVDSPIQQSSTTPVNITNHGTDCLRIMRVSVSATLKRKDTSYQREDDSGLSIEVDIHGNGNVGSSGKAIGAITPGGKGDVVIRPGETVVGALSVTCRSVPKHDEANKTFEPAEYIGSILIRAGLSTLSDYEQWREFVVEETNYVSSNHILLELPLNISVFNGSLKYDAEQFYFPLDLSSYPSTLKGETFVKNGGATDRIERVLQLRNAFPFPILLRAFSIVNISNKIRVESSLENEQVDGTNEKVFCRQFDVISSEGISLLPGSILDATNLKIGYHSVVESISNEDTQCGLAIELVFGSFPSVEYILPFKHFDGRVVARLDHGYSETSEVKFLSCSWGRRWNKDIGRKDNRCITHWFRNTAPGRALSDYILNEMAASSRCSKKRQECNDNSSDDDPFDQFFSRSDTCKQSGCDRRDQVDPIILSLGTLPPSSLKKYSILLTNPNPMALNVTSDNNGKTIGASIELGKVPTEPLHRFGIRVGSSDQMKLGDERLRSFLSSSLPDQSFFGELTHSDDIEAATPADSALISQELLAIYSRYAVASVRYSSSSGSKVPVKYECDQEEFASDGCRGSASSNARFHRNSTCKRPFYRGTISDGLLIGSGNMKCRTDASSTEVSLEGTSSWSLPPASTARFVLNIRTPPIAALLDQREEDGMEVIPFVSAGLVLRTDFGQAVPIVLTYQVILGNVTAEAASKSLSGGHTGLSVFPYRDTSDPNPHIDEVGRLQAVYVPTSILPPRSESYVTAVPQEEKSDARFSIQSLLGDNVELSEIKTCSPWFHVDLDQNRTTATAVQTATSRSSIRCQKSNFYACALLFLESRNAVQPTGCGLDRDALVKVYPKLMSTLKNNSGHGFSLVDDDDKLIGHSDDEIILKQNKVISEGIMALRLALEKLDAIYGGEAATVLQTSNSEYVEPTEINSFVEARRAWDKVKKMGLHVVTSGLSANANHQIGRISLPLPRTILWSTLDIPRLFYPSSTHNDDHDDSTSEGVNYLLDSEDNGIVEFPKTIVADVAIAYIPVRNPSGLPVKLRLVAMTPKSVLGDRKRVKPASDQKSGTRGKTGKREADSSLLHGSTVYVHSAETNSAMLTSDEMPSAATTLSRHVDTQWWNGGMYYQSADYDDTVLTSKHNVTIKSTGGAHVALVNPSIDSMSALVAGCGRRRCGLRDGQQFEAQPGQQLTQQQQTHNEAQLALLNTPERLFSTMGASAARESPLQGRLYDADTAEETSESVEHGKRFFRKGALSAFSFDKDAREEVILSPGETALLGPVFFRPPERFTYDASFSIENSLTGIETVTLRGTGAIEQVVFSQIPVPVNEDDESIVNNAMPLRVDHYFGLPTVLFPFASSSAISSADTLDSSANIVGKVKVENIGDISIAFTSASLTSNLLSHVTHRPLHPLDVDFRKEGDIGVDSVIHTEGESDHMQSSGCSSAGAFRLLDSTGRYRRDLHNENEQNETKRNDLSEGFILKPNESQVLGIAYAPDCCLRRVFVALNLEYSTGNIVAQDFGAREKCSSDLYKMNKPDRCRDAMRREKKHAFLLIGHESMPDEVPRCVPHSQAFPSVAYGTVERLKLSFASSILTSRPEDSDEEESSDTYRMISFVCSIAFIVALSSYSLGCILRLKYLIRSSVSLSERSSSSSLPSFQHEGWKSGHAEELYLPATNAADLYHVGREHNRQILLSRLKRSGVSMPSCLRTNGVFVRGGDFWTNRGGGEKVTAEITNTGQNSASKPKPSAHAEETQAPATNRVPCVTLSEAIFDNTDILQSMDLHSSTRGPTLPTGLAWRNAAIRGIISCMERGPPAVGTRVRELLQRRSLQGEDDQFGTVAIAHAIAIIDDESDETGDDENGDESSEVPTAIESDYDISKRLVMSKPTPASPVTLDNVEKEEVDIASLLPAETSVTKTSREHQTGYFNKNAEPTNNKTNVTSSPSNDRSKYSPRTGYSSNKNSANAILMEATHVEPKQSTEQLEQSSSSRNAGRAGKKSDGRGNRLPKATRKTDKSALEHRNREKSPAKRTQQLVESQGRAGTEKAQKLHVTSKTQNLRDSGRKSLSRSSELGTRSSIDEDRSRFQGVFDVHDSVDPSEGMNIYTASKISEVETGASTGGLAPPPGFASTAKDSLTTQVSKPENILADLSRGLDGLDNAWLRDRPGVGTAPESDAGDARRQSRQINQDDAPLMASLLHLDNGPGLNTSPQPPSSSSPGTFNVMNFLDTILDDSGMIEDDVIGANDAGRVEENASVRVGFRGRDSLSMGFSSAVGNSSISESAPMEQRYTAIGVRSDPWAAAGTVGDAADGSTNSDVGNSTSSRLLVGNISIPLLTPESILQDQQVEGETSASAADETCDGGSSKKEDDYFARNSFFDSLIRGSIQEEEQS